ncbi:C-C motif chemokine 28 [Hemicordylus capensis]|uniref:C-C motif chemokine 28 n=1 Tax=Hemicordylus capensis TaxID=884348 RepID=UPI0023031D46|nr:C-C motif chemokine 28 [Hemicordylus capensis]
MKLGVVLVTLGLVIVHVSEAFFPIIFDCCTEAAHHVPRRWLRTVLKFDIQKGDGLCKIPAVILHTKYKKLCVSPQNKNVKRWMKRMSKRRQRMGHRARKKKKSQRRIIVIQ